MLGSVDIDQLPPCPTQHKVQSAMEEVSTHSWPEQGYLLGLRGFLVIQSFQWVFLQTFVPVAVKDSINTSGTPYEKVLRQSLSVLVWNDSLIYSSFILLSARTICIPYLQNPTKTVAASTIFRRGLRLWLPTAVALAVVKILSSTIGTVYVDQFKQETGNVSFETPYEMPNALAYFNSVFNLFWTNNRFFEQAGNTAFPSQTLWMVNVIYTQSYTVYLTMVMIPYTRNKWRVRAYICFIVTAWWVQSWAWYSITGLLLADVVMNMQYAEKARHGVKIWRSIRCPTWIPCLLMMAAGLVMQFLWTDWRPQYENKELLAHTGLYYSGGYNKQVNAKEPQARDDDYLLLLGFYLLLECFGFARMLFQNPFFVYLGRRSLSWLLVQSIIIYTAGIKLYMYLSTQKHYSVEVVRSICLIVCVAAVVLGAELFHRLVDHPSQMLARIVFDWIRK